MKHKVTCMDCGKTEPIEIQKGLPNGGSEWGYYGKLNVNSCQTSKFLLKQRVQGKLDFNDMVKIDNPCYDPKVKPKYVEVWCCPQCLTNEKMDGSSSSLVRATAQAKMGTEDKKSTLGNQSPTCVPKQSCRVGGSNPPSHTITSVCEKSTGSEKK